ncbi:MAG TPA: TerC family protein [Candidatus Binatia bacterium]|nr:TerC family protein [Candidatus Binatia bacterium]
MTENAVLLWGLFNAFIIGMLVLDLVVFHRKPKVMSLREALLWTGFWVGLAIVFGAGMFWFRGARAGTEFVTGYLIEESLSVDNLFVFLLIFRYFKVAPEFQHGVLFWGILGALCMRLVFILTGVSLLERFHWLIYIFAAVLIVSGIRLWNDKDKEVEPEKNPVIRAARKIFKVRPGSHGGALFAREHHRFAVTPLFIVLLSLETTDLIFAVDSIPAVLAITRDPFIVYSSNAFAVLGLRSLFFALSSVMGRFHYLHYGLSAILVFVGLKMLLSSVYPIPTLASLAVVALLLAVSVVASFLWPAKTKPAASASPEESL